MSFSGLKNEMSQRAALERELNLKQLQINRLLNITQAINNNVSAADLYKMYESFLTWEIGVKKMALFVQEDEKDWVCQSHHGVPNALVHADVSEELARYTRPKNIETNDHPLAKAFDVVVPVQHKNIPIAYVFLGGFEEDEDMYNKIQFITTITNVIAVAIENKRLFNRQLEQERLRHEMNLASDMQRMLIPKSFPKKDCYELASVYQPHLGVGGDYFDFEEFGDGKIVFCIGDISGKGLAAALLMANFQAVFHTQILRRASLEDLIHTLNESLFRVTQGDKFITYFVAEYDTKTKLLRYVNAGHNPPILVSVDEVLELRLGTTMLGAFEEIPFLEIGEINVPDEAMIVTYTDGLTDLRNDRGDYFDEDKLQQFVQQHYRLGAQTFMEVLMNTLEKFKGEQRYPDDFTTFVCKIFHQPVPC